MKMLRSIVSLACLVGVIAAIYYFAYLPVLQVQSAMRVKADELENRNRELQQRIAMLAPSHSHQKFPEELLLRASTKQDAELALQDRVVAQAGDSGLYLLSFNAASLRRDTEQGVMSVSIEGEGTLGQFYAFLADLETSTPRLAIGTARLRPIQRSQYAVEDVAIYFQLVIWSFWTDVS